MLQTLCRIVCQFQEKLNKIHLLYDLAITLLGLYCQEMKTMSTQKNLYIIVDSSFMCNSPKLETTNMSLNRRMAKQIVIYLYHGILCSDNKKVSVHVTTWVILKCIELNEKIIAMGHIPYYFYITFLKLQYCRNGEEIIGCQGLVMVGERE